MLIMYLRVSTNALCVLHQRGLRTLVVAYKKLNQRDYTRLIRNIEVARQVIGQDRGTLIQRAYEEMENGLTLLGVTAVEDRLQEDVEETLECLKVAGIKVHDFSIGKRHLKSFG